MKHSIKPVILFSVLFSALTIIGCSESNDNPAPVFPTQNTTTGTGTGGTTGDTGGVNPPITDNPVGTTGGVNPPITDNPVGTTGGVSPPITDNPVGTTGGVSPPITDNPVGTTGGVTPPITTPGGANELVGRWVTQCFPNSVDNNAAQLEINFTSNTGTISERTFLNTQACSGTIFLSRNLLSTYIVGNEVTPLAGGDARHVDVTYTNGSYTAGQGLIDALASEGTTLEATLSSLGITGDLNNLSLAQLGISQAAYYTIYRVDGGQQLSLGETDASYTGLSPALRPIALRSISYSKVP